MSDFSETHSSAFDVRMLITSVPFSLCVCSWVLHFYWVFEHSVQYYTVCLVVAFIAYTIVSAMKTLHALGMWQVTCLTQVWLLSGSSAYFLYMCHMYTSFCLWIVQIRRNPLDTLTFSYWLKKSCNFVKRRNQVNLFLQFFVVFTIFHVIDEVFYWSSIIFANLLCFKSIVHWLV